jgi:hypothetical protein
VAPLTIWGKFPTVFISYMVPFYLPRPSYTHLSTDLSDSSLGSGKHPLLSDRKAIYGPGAEAGKDAA